MGKLDGRTAIVLGGGQGVGRGIALALAKEGAAVAIAGRTLEKCERTKREVEAAAGRAIALVCDVSKPEQVESVVAETVATFGGVQILVNNAHASRPLTPLAETTDKDMAVALKGMHGAFNFMRACFPHLKAKGGAVINLGSISGIRGDAGFAAYAAAKEGIRALSRVAAREWGVYGITVNVLCPFSDSPGVDYMIENNPDFIPKLTEETVMKRLGSSEHDVGRAAVFLASPDANYLTGQTLNVDGGMWIAP
ncbi:MAG: SDR family oxidoreductase [Parvularculaceae bacterium]|nr:SDR family oxidoreductase [Parvularculaceae bacterium]